MRRSVARWWTASSCNKAELVKLLLLLDPERQETLSVGKALALTVRRSSPAEDSPSIRCKGNPTAIRNPLQPRPGHSTSPRALLAVQTNTSSLGLRHHNVRPQDAGAGRIRRRLVHPGLSSCLRPERASRVSGRADSLIARPGRFQRILMPMTIYGIFDIDLS